MGVRESLLRSAAWGLSSVAGHGRLQILIYHRVLAEPDIMRPSEPTADEFDSQMNVMARSFNVLSLSEACRRLASGTLPARAACITFDDGYADNFEVAVPILKRYGLTATFFVAPGFLDGGRMWNDTIFEVTRRLSPAQLERMQRGMALPNGSQAGERPALAASLCRELKHLDYNERQKRVEAFEELVDGELPSDLMMSAGQLKKLSGAGMEVGAHTVTHPILSRLDDSRCRAEIDKSKCMLEDIIGRSVDLFAYPNGAPGRDYGPRHVEMVRKAGFAAAVSTRWGVAESGSDLFELPRFTPWQRSSDMFYLALAMNYLKKTPASDAVALVQNGAD